tara:strand:+ start:1431 stop:1769 length:339 start_codon:yes stop_codon:yes gene_type:complete
MNAKDTIKLMEEAGDIATLNTLLLAEEDRKTVLAAYHKRHLELDRPAATTEDDPELKPLGNWFQELNSGDYLDLGTRDKETAQGFVDGGYAHVAKGKVTDTPPAPGIEVHPV